MPPRPPAALLAFAALSEMLGLASAAGGVITARPPAAAQPPPPPVPEDTQMGQDELLELAFERLEPPPGQQPLPNLHGEERQRRKEAAARDHLGRCMKSLPHACGPKVSPTAGGTAGVPEPDGNKMFHMHFVRADPNGPPHEGAVVCAPPKTGSTSFMAMMWRMFTGKDDLKGVFIHKLDPEAAEHQVGMYAAMREGLLAPNPTAPTRTIASQRPLRISFVRSPYTRTYSGWVDKVAKCRSGVTNDVPLCIRINQQFAEVAGMQDKLYQGKPALTWPEFTEALVKVSEAGRLHEMNAHFHTQCMQCRIDKVGYDLIAPAEQGFAVAQRIVTRWLFPGKGDEFVDRITASGRPLNAAARRHVVTLEPEEIWTKETIANLNKVYAEDLAVMPWYRPPHEPKD
eukprot:TRINITY_DN895_c0_g1_i2.p2 TRINITY_DN895_c0_g1~~TRINITY_DN895_c0_g1_i2.p2  ORF type:complete len:435 (+),score=157.08 TRINITY_DN895_c0_g1_i2:108-1307(+)